MTATSASIRVEPSVITGCARVIEGEIVVALSDTQHAEHVAEALRAQQLVDGLYEYIFQLEDMLDEARQINRRTRPLTRRQSVNRTRR